MKPGLNLTRGLRKRRWASAIAVVLASLAASVGAAGTACSGKTIPQGGLMLVIRTDGSLTQATRLHLDVASSDGATVYRNADYALPSDTTLPTTLGIDSNGSPTASVVINASLWAGTTLLDDRVNQVFQIPTSYVGELDIVFSANCTALAETVDGGATSSCAQGSTCDPMTGLCVGDTVNGGTLPPFTGDAGTNGTLPVGIDDGAAEGGDATVDDAATDTGLVDAPGDSGQDDAPEDTGPTDAGHDTGTPDGSDGAPDADAAAGRDGGDAGNDAGACDPAAYDFAGVCTKTAPPTTCDQGLLADAGASDFVKALDLCGTSSDASHWGLVSASFTAGHASQTAGGGNFDQQHGVLPSFGATLLPREGAMMGALSTGSASVYDSDQGPLFKGQKNGMQVARVAGPLPAGFPKATPGCPIAASQDDIIDLKLQVRVPTNAHGFTLGFNFLSGEWPEYVCSAFNDGFIAYLTSSAFNGGAPDNIAQDPSGAPVSINASTLPVCTRVRLSAATVSTLGFPPAPPAPRRSPEPDSASLPTEASPTAERRSASAAAARAGSRPALRFNPER